MPLNRATRILLLACGCLYLTGELAAWTGQRYSNFYRRIREESREAQAIRPGNPPTILFVGNSLLKYGVDFDQLNRELAGRYRASRFVMEGSAYYDWYYGLRTMFDRGMRPNAVVLCLNAGFLADPTPPDPLSAHLLFDLASIRQIASDLHPGATAVSSLYLGHFSPLLGSGPELRGVLLGKLIPAPDMWDNLLPPILPFAGDPHFSEVVSPRLRRVRELCEAHGTRFWFLIPPMREQGDVEIAAAAKAGGTAVLHPIPNFTLPLGDYRDGYHLNEEGAAVFTSAIARALPK